MPRWEKHQLRVRSHSDHMTFQMKHAGTKHESYSAAAEWESFLNPAFGTTHVRFHSCGCFCSAAEMTRLFAAGQNFAVQTEVVAVLGFGTTEARGVYLDEAYRRQGSSGGHLQRARVIRGLEEINHFRFNLWPLGLFEVKGCWHKALIIFPFLDLLPTYPIRLQRAKGHRLISLQWQYLFVYLFQKLSVCNKDKKKTQLTVDTTFPVATAFLQWLAKVNFILHFVPLQTQT